MPILEKEKLVTHLYRDIVEKLRSLASATYRYMSHMDIAIKMARHMTSQLHPTHNLDTNYQWLTTKFPPMNRRNISELLTWSHHGHDIQIFLFVSKLGKHWLHIQNQQRSQRRFMALSEHCELNLGSMGAKLGTSHSQSALKRKVSHNLWHDAPSSSVIFFFSLTKHCRSVTSLGYALGNEHAVSSRWTAKVISNVPVVSGIALKTQNYLAHQAEAEAEYLTWIAQLFA